MLFPRPTIFPAAGRRIARSAPTAPLKLSPQKRVAARADGRRVVSQVPLLRRPGHQPTEVARVRAGPATEARGSKKAPTRARRVASPVDPVSYPPPRPLLLLLLFQTEHARGDGTCARRGAYSAAKSEARARGAGLGRVVGAQQRGHVPDLGLVLGVRLPGCLCHRAARGLSLIHI